VDGESEPAEQQGQEKNEQDKRHVLKPFSFVPLSTAGPATRSEALYTRKSSQVA
jgi:hypothetical protein